MEDNKQSAMAELYASTVKSVKEGHIVKGTVVAITAKEAVIDIGFKSEGFILLEEFRNKEELELGREIDVLVESVEDDEGRLVLSRSKAEKVKGWQKVMVDIEEGHVVDGRVVKQVKGGYMVDVEGVEGFLPMSLSAFKGYANDTIMANKFNFQVAKINKQRRNLILSRRDIFQKERDTVREKLWGELKKANVVRVLLKGSPILALSSI